MRKAAIYRNNHLAGHLLEEEAGSFTFIYDDQYFSDPKQPAISLTLPKKRQVFRSPFLFPFFFNLLSEGVNRALQSRQLKIDEKDDFGLLLATAQYDTIGAISVKAVEA